MPQKRDDSKLFENYPVFFLNLLKMLVQSQHSAPLVFGHHSNIAISEINRFAFLLHPVSKLPGFKPCILLMVNDIKSLYEILYDLYFFF